MKQRQYITIFGLIMTLTGLSPIVTADAGSTSVSGRIQEARQDRESPQRYELGQAQLDRVHAGETLHRLTRFTGAFKQAAEHILYDRIR